MPLRAAAIGRAPIAPFAAAAVSAPAQLCVGVLIFRGRKF